MSIDPSTGYPPTDAAPAKYAGDIHAQARQFILDIDAAMRANYATNIVNIGQAIYPIIYAESTFDGGRYTLVVDEHTSYVAQNVAPIYDQTKAIAHIPLGIFSIMSAYTDYSAFGQWKPALQAYHDKVVAVRDSFASLDIKDSDVTQACESILKISIAFMEGLLKGTTTFSFVLFQNYAHSLNYNIGILQTAAAKNQIEVMSKVLTGWKAMLGDKWDKLYVVVSAIWTLSQESAHELIIKSFMKPALRETNVIVSEAVGTLELARTLLGRIIGDRIMAALVFDVNLGKDFAEDIYSLSTRRDLLSQAIEKQLSPDATKAACPHLA